MKKLFLIIFFAVVFMFSFGSVYAQLNLPFVITVDWNHTGTHILQAFNTGVVEVVAVDTSEITQHIELNGIFRDAIWNPAEAGVFVIALDSFETRSPMLMVINSDNGETIFAEDFSDSRAMMSSYISAIAWSPDGRLIAVAMDFATASNITRDIEILDTNSGRVVTQIGLGRVGSTHLDWNATDNILVSSGTDGSVSVWDLYSTQRVSTLNNTLSTEFALSPDANWLVGANDDPATSLQVWDMTAGDLSVVIPTTPAQTIVWHPDSIHIATIRDEQTITIWNLAFATLIREIEFENTVYALAWHPDGTKLAVGTVGETQIIEINP